MRYYTNTVLLFLPYGLCVNPMLSFMQTRNYDQQAYWTPNLTNDNIPTQCVSKHAYIDPPPGW